MVGCSTNAGGGPTRSAPPAQTDIHEIEQVGSSALVPSREDDHARLLLTTGNELARSLESIDGVLGARVHLAVSWHDPLSDSQEPAATASVLLRHRGRTPPVDDRQVQTLVASAVPGLAPDRVAVVRISEAATAAPPELARVGPFTTTRDSASRLRAALAVLSSLNIALVALVLGAWARNKRTREGAARIARGAR